MKTLIAYSSKHGATARIAGILNVKLNGTARLVNLGKEKLPDLNHYDIIIIGGSIYNGKIGRTLQKYLEQHQDVMLKKHLGIYLSCLEKDRVAESQFNQAFPAALREHAFATGILGGEVLFNKINLLERLIIGRSQNIRQSTTRINNKAIDEFVKKIHQVLSETVS
jgi:menaquinone-dependent protoporphyrinogen oxidase